MSRLTTSIIAAAALALAAESAQAAEPMLAPADWGKALAEDARSFHDIIAENHPGPVDPENPGFKPLLDAGLQTALDRAKTADSYQDWVFALEQYAASFDDGHLGLKRIQEMGYGWPTRWPGFLTAQTDDGGHTVVVSRDPGAPPLGAVLESCDRRAAEPLAAELVGLGAGRWMLRSQRVRHSGELFVDWGNPYVRRPETCVFTIDGKRRSYRLAWRDLPAAERNAALADARPARFTAPIELRRYGDRGFWIGLGSFESDATAPNGVKLEALKAELAREASSVRTADVIVFDLRGNHGGSSAWINAIATILWGEIRMEAQVRDTSRVDWRPSRDNLAALVAFRPMAGDDPVLNAWLDQAIAGMEGALKDAAPLWREPEMDLPKPEIPVTPAAAAMRARTYVLTDYGCGSACLDAVDLLTALGAVQVGQETSADTLYMENRDAPLASGRAVAYVPMKVYRGRPRGANVSARPAHSWTGALDDTPGLEAWIAEIDARP